MKAEIYNAQLWVAETNPEILKAKLCKTLLDSGFSVLKFTEHYFKPYGYTGLYLLAESHLAIHTFPEENKTYVEISSCNYEYFEKFTEGFPFRILF